MKLALLLALAATPLLRAQAGGQPPDLNVNSRYRVESVDFANHRQYRLSSAVVEDMQRLIGQRLNTESLTRLANRLRGELRAHRVTFKVARGAGPDHVRVLFEVDRRGANFDVHIPAFAYNSTLGWSAEGEAGVLFGNNQIVAGLLSDGETRVARTAGLKARFERASPGGRLRFAFEFDKLHAQYSGAASAALRNHSSLGAGADRSRTNFQPSASFAITEALTFTTGFSFQRLDPQFTAARTESSNALINTLRYHRRWTGSDASTQDVDAGYSLRAATHLLGGDVAYARHAVNFRYAHKRDSQSVEVALLAGVIYGRAPLFERFVLGNSSTLRGWNKDQLAPLGGNRVAHASVTYGYHIMRVFYDAGSVWDRGQGFAVKHSAGAGVSTSLGLFRRDAFLLALAFPIRQGRIEPVFIAGMNF